MEVLGLPLVAMVLIVAVSGVIIYHLRNLPTGEYDTRKIVDSRLAIFGTAVAGAFVTIPQLITPNMSTEGQLFVLLGIVGSIAGFSFVGQKANGKRNARKVSQQLEEIQKAGFDKDGIENKTKKIQNSPASAHVSVVPFLTPVGAWYQTNLVKNTKKGKKVHPFGSAYLWIKMSGVKSYLNVILRGPDGSPIQIRQSHELDEDNNIETTRLKMYSRNGTPMPRGKYTLHVIGDRGTSDSTGTPEDQFIIA